MDKFGHMNTSELALKERIKELTCLYEVTSIIVNADYDQMELTFKAIAYSLKKAFQFPDKTEITIKSQIGNIQTGTTVTKNKSIVSAIFIFNESKGSISAALKESALATDKFLKEEQLLLDNVALKIGNLLERIEIKRSELSMKRQMEHADRLTILGELTAGIAHELNTPLANILGFAELLQSKLENDPQSISDLDKIITNVIFSREVVKKLMFFACEMPQEMNHLNLVSIIKDSITLLEPTFRKNNVKYIVKIDDDTLSLRADPVQMTQIIFNLLMNAIYFSPKDGLVTIAAAQNEKNIILKISDEGKGFDIKDIGKVFQPFFTTKQIGDGSGLGLSVVHGIVVSHKGSITAENNIKKGAIFTVTLPKD